MASAGCTMSASSSAARAPFVRRSLAPAASSCTHLRSLAPPPPASAARLLRTPSRRAVQVCVKAADGDKSGKDGDKEVQNKLEDMILLQTGAQRIVDFTEDKKAEWQGMVDEEKEKLDQVMEAASNRADLEFKMAQDNIDASVADVEKMIAETRALAEAEKLANEEFELQVERDLSMGLPFKTLYSKAPKLSAEEQKIVGAEELDALEEVTREQLGSRWRVLQYGFVALALFGLSVAALSKDSAVGKAMFVGFLLVFGALGAQVFAEQEKILQDNPFKGDDQ